MIRTVVGLVVCATVGLLIGIAAAGPLAGVLGALLGALFMLLFLSVRSSAKPIPAGTPTERERVRVNCFSYGENADCVMVRDADTGEWLDVVECSLRPGEVTCHKKCVTFMNDVKPKPRPAPEAQAT